MASPPAGEAARRASASDAEEPTTAGAAAVPAVVGSLALSSDREGDVEGDGAGLRGLGVSGAADGGRTSLCLVSVGPDACGAPLGATCATSSPDHSRRT